MRQERMIKVYKDSRISLTFAAGALRVDKKDFGRFLQGNKQMTVKFLMQFAEYFGVSADYLLGLSDVETPNTDLRAVCEYTGLSQKSVETLHFAKMVKSPLSPVMAAMVNAVTDDDVLRELQEIKKAPTRAATLMGAIKP